MLNHRTLRLCSVTLLLSLAFAIGAAPVAARTNTKKLRDAVTVDNINRHAIALQRIADRNGGTRASGTPGYRQSVDYVAGLLRVAGYQVTIQPFDFEYTEVRAAELVQIAPPGGAPLVAGEDFLVGFGSANRDVTGQVRAVDINLAGDRATTSGCEAADFAGFAAGSIALIQRGSCNFTVKVANATAAGAVAVILFNQGNPNGADDRFGLFSPDVTGSTVPVVAATFDVGAELAGLVPGLTMRVNVNIFSETRETYNVLAETRKGDDSQVVMVGAHLDSVLEGPGINDNGSGSATILEIALQFAKLNINPKNTLRFAFWGAEESGLLGADYYVSQLSEEEAGDIALYLNFDMVGSPNFARFVYDGDNSLGTGEAGPEGSAFIESVFMDYFREVGLASEPTPFDGRSDYGPFIAVGIPAGGLFTGAEDIKTPAQAARYGGTAGIPFDPCYHQACDNLGNLSRTALDQMSDAAAHAVMSFATTPHPFKVRGKSAQAPAKGHYKGPNATR